MYSSCICLKGLGKITKILSHDSMYTNRYSNKHTPHTSKQHYDIPTSAVTRVSQLRNSYENFVGRPTRRWEDNIKMYFKDIMSENVELVQLFQDGAKWRDENGNEK
jgi:hypothetical protein